MGAGSRRRAALRVALPAAELRRPGSLAFLGMGGAALLALTLFLPLLALVVSARSASVLAGLAHPNFLPALRLSLQTTSLSLVAVIALGTPLAWWLARSSTASARWVGVLVDLPILMPPAVLGIALLLTFGRQGMLAPALELVGWHIPFSQAAVVLAQVVVAAPFFIQSAARAFAEVDDDTLLVARTLGATGTTVFLRVALPLARPGLVTGACLAWARALGEFGATLLFAGNMSGRTQTLPLAIFTALEQDLDLAVAFSLVLVAFGVLLLGLLRVGGRSMGPDARRKEASLPGIRPSKR